MWLFKCIFAYQNPRAPAPQENLQPEHIIDAQLDVGVGEFPNANAEPDHPLLLQARLDGEEKRNRIAEMLWQQAH